MNQDEPALDPADLRAPAELTGAALKVWKRLAPHLVLKGVLTEGDVDQFLTFCKIVAEVREYEARVAKVGHADAHRLGYAGHLLKLRAAQKQYAAELGLTPSSRRGVKAVPRPTSDQARRQRFFGIVDDTRKKA